MRTLSTALLALALLAGASACGRHDADQPGGAVSDTATLATPDTGTPDASALRAKPGKSKRWKHYKHEKWRDTLHVRDDELPPGTIDVPTPDSAWVEDSTLVTEDADSLGADTLPADTVMDSSLHVSMDGATFARFADFRGAYRAQTASLVVRVDSTVYGADSIAVRYWSLDSTVMVRAPAPTPTPIPEPTPTPTPTPTPAPDEVVASRFFAGPFNPIDACAGSGWHKGGAVVDILPVDLTALRAALKCAKANRVKVVAVLAGGAHSYYQGSDGKWSFAKYRDRVNRYNTSGHRALLRAYADSGVIVAHYTIDEPNVAAVWFGSQIPKPLVDSASWLSDQIFGAGRVPAGPRVKCSWAVGYTWRYVDFCWEQYSVNQGNISTFIANALKAAASAKLKMIGGINVVNGGTRPSGDSWTCTWGRGTYTPNCRMSPTQVSTLGAAWVASSVPVIGFTWWQWDSKMYGDSRYTSAFSSVITKAASR